MSKRRLKEHIAKLSLQLERGNEAGLWYCDGLTRQSLEWYTMRDERDRAINALARLRTAVERVVGAVICPLCSGNGEGEGSSCPQCDGRGMPPSDQVVGVLRVLAEEAAG